MDIVIPSNRAKRIEIAVSADTKKAFATYAKNLKTVFPEGEPVELETLMASWLVSFKESEDFKEVAELANQAKAEKKAEREKEKAEKEVRKAKRLAEAEAKKAEKIAKLQAEIDKLKEN